MLFVNSLLTNSIIKDKIYLSMSNEDKKKQTPMAIQLRALRKSAGLSQEILASKLGVTKQAVSAYETGRANPTAPVLQRLSQALGVGVDTIINYQGANTSVESQGEAPFDVNAIGPLADQPHVDLPFPGFKTLASFGETGGLSLATLANCATLRVYLQPDELPAKYEGAMVIEVWGDSMEPHLYSGDRMIVWQIPNAKWESLNNVDCVVAYDDTVTIKAIVENDLFVYDRLTLRAANPTSGYFVVPRASIHSIWEVREYYKRPKYSPSSKRR